MKKSPYILRSRYLLAGCIEIFKIKERRDKNKQKFYLFGIPFMTRHGREIDKPDVLRELDFLKSIHLPALVAHQKTFPKYQGIHAGRDVVIVGAGPSLDQYKPIENAIHIGVNKTIFSKNISLDYLFIQDYFEDLQDAADEYRGNACKKFYGIHYMKDVSAISDAHAIRANAERYYFVDLPFPCQTILPFPPDISVAPLGTFSSVILPAMQFALWTRPRRIFLVGCDCTNLGYSKDIKPNEQNLRFPLNVERLRYGWEAIKQFANKFYPETEIISVNPVGLRGLFKDLTM